MPFAILALIACGICGLIYNRWQRDILHAQIPLLQKLPPDLHAPLEGKINLFFDQVAMYGCDGLELTEEMMLSIAGQACLLIVNTDAWYKNLRTVLVYPGAFKSRGDQRRRWAQRGPARIRTPA